MAGKPSPTVSHLRGVVGATALNHPDDQAAIDDAKRALKTELLAEYVKKIVDTAPPLTDEQRARISALLRNGGA